MSIVSQSSDRSDVNDTGYSSKVVTVGTSQVELFTGVSRNPARQAVILYNDSSSILYIGPSGVTTSGSTKGYPVEKKQTVTIQLGDVAIYAIAGTAGNSMIVQEVA